MSANPSTLAERIRAVRRRIAAAAAEHHRDPANITLIAASKGRSVPELQAAVAEGLTSFGENHWQEAGPKLAALAEAHLQWHFIGPVQSNKSRGIGAAFATLHSLDSEKLAGRLATQRPTELPRLRVLVQVNISREDTKRGVLPEATERLVAAVLTHERLHLCGLMAIPRPGRDGAGRAPFAELRRLRDDLQRQFSVALPELSMGMSGDLEDAIAEGATMVRVGTAIFGPRPGVPEHGKNPGPG